MKVYGESMNESVVVVWLLQMLLFLHTDSVL